MIDAKEAIQLTRGFGIRNKDIKMLTNKTNAQLGKIFNMSKKGFKKLGVQGKRSLFLVYFAGHGAAD